MSHRIILKIVGFFTFSFYLVGVAAALPGQQNIVLPQGIGKKRRKRAATAEQLQFLQEVLQEVYCDGAPAGSIVPGSCKLQVLDYNSPPVCNYLLTLEILDQTALVAALDDVNKNIETNAVIKTKIIDAGGTAKPGTIGGFS